MFTENDASTPLPAADSPGSGEQQAADLGHYRVVRRDGRSPRP